MIVLFIIFQSSDNKPQISIENNTSSEEKHETCKRRCGVVIGKRSNGLFRLLINNKQIHMCPQVTISLTHSLSLSSFFLTKVNIVLLKKEKEEKVIKICGAELETKDTKSFFFLLIMFFFK